MLDPDSDFDIFCLHYVFIPRINLSLMHWKNAWVKHPIRSENNLSPEQLWFFGLQSIAGSEARIAQEVFHDVSDIQDFGIDWEGPIASVDSEGVVVPDVEYQPEDDKLQELMDNVHPLSESDEQGVDLYVKAKMILLS